MRRVVIGGVVTLTILSIVVVLLERAVLSQLASTGVGWSAFERNLNGWLVSNVRWGPLEAKRAHLDWRNLRVLVIEDAVVDLGAFQRSNSQNLRSLARASSSTVGGARLEVHDLRFEWNEEVLLEGLSGHIDSNEIHFVGEGVTVQSSDEEGVDLIADLNHTFQEKFLKGDLSLKLKLGEKLLIEGQSKRLSVRHELQLFTAKSS